MTDPTTLLTGFPGFIASRLIPRILEADPATTLVALVEPRMVARATELAATLGAGRIVVEPGDITRPRLGLTPERHAELAATTTQVHHLAAVYDLAVGAELAERVNVTGTQEVLAFCRACTGLERHHYVSTAYVAGLRSGRVMEDDLVGGQAFKNHYESTKFAAEVLVRASMAQVPTTVYRPAIVVGDSKTGETQKFDGPYYLLRTLQRLGDRQPIPQIGRGDASFNVVPVDFVIDAIAAGIATPATIGHTLHLVDPAPVTSSELMCELARHYSGRQPSYRVPPGVLDRSLAIGVVRNAFGGTPRQSIRYLNHPVTFDTTQTTELLGAAGLRCPPFREYVGAMVAFFRKHQDDPAFRPARP